MPAIISDFLKLFLDRRVSLASKFLFIALVGVYLVLPIDLIPDFLLPLGMVDDGGLILAAVVAFTRHARNQVEDSDGSAASGNYDTVLAPSALPSEAETGREIALAENEPASPTEAQRSVYIQREYHRGGTNYGCLGLFALLIFSPFVGMAILVLSSGMALSGLIAPIIDLFDLPASANVVSGRTIVQSLHGLGQLVAVRGEFVKSDVQVSVQEGFLNSGYHSANHVAVGVIEAGVDITRFASEDLRFDLETGVITLTLPEPMITSCNIDHIDQYEYSVSLLQKDWDTVRQLAEYDAIIQFRQDALEGGILNRAKEDITYRLGTFVNTLTGSPVDIEFKENSNGNVFGDTCLPDVPGGWQFDAESGEWVRTE
ncbi:MAG: DUF4230 domain-containing protein [Chloroflexi bacterium]|nr:DUF4230 domain-containing protein [Chloroflexota bacterium]